MDTLQIKSESGNVCRFTDFIIYSITDKYARFLLGEEPHQGLFLDVRKSGDRWLVLARYKDVRIVSS